MADSYVSGFCNIGSHEGTMPVGLITGAPMKVCEMWQSCSCDCHSKLTMMYEMTETPRVAVPNPKYVRPERTYWMPSDEPGYALPVPVADLTEDGSIAVLDKEVAVTATGRTQRGGLEFWVQRECLAWVLDHDEGEFCTPKFLSNEIARVEGIAPPSQGAIAAVFARWEKYGYARIAHDRPQRFLGLTAEGQLKGLDWCRAHSKKEAKG